MNVTAHAIYGKSGSKVHAASAFIDGRGRTVLASSTPACGAYTRPGSGVVVVSPITCTRCLANMDETA